MGEAETARAPDAARAASDLAERGPEAFPD